MKYLIIVVMCVLGIIVAIEAQNYCAANLCPSGRRHIGCDNNGRFAATCPRGAFLVNMVPHVNMILQIHNSRRNIIAGGRLRGYRPALRMATMQWDNELAALAALNVKRCVMRHDQCRNTNIFRRAGQNLALMRYSGLVFTNAQLIRSQINEWWNEHRNCRMRFINQYPRNYSGPKIGHFTVMVAQNQIRIGCAAARYAVGRRQNFLLACNYARTNIFESPIYVAGRTAARCRRGRSRRYPNLCAIGEPYSVTI